ncbi:hypothetical protein CISIN_1g046576mg [Citrus sinensis]|uniref:Uncharacterized protein n=1 Tax=Citrus sinensis TaxID=2711 RepID=A0A067D9X4_CITSI|nr:hypothetical protein CISIN_1g046576mg [Citrus sinensis]
MILPSPFFKMKLQIKENFHFISLNRICRITRHVYTTFSKEVKLFKRLKATYFATSTSASTHSKLLISTDKISQHLCSALPSRNSSAKRLLFKKSRLHAQKINLS